MPATPQTTEARAIAARMREFPALQGNLQYIRKLIYEDSAVVHGLIPLIEAATEDQDIIRGVYNAAAVCGSCGEGGGNIQMWGMVPIAADQLDAALDVLEGGPGGGLQTPPAMTAIPIAMQDGGVLRCSTGAWNGTPTAYAYNWLRSHVPFGADQPIYILVAGDVGRTFACLVTATNEAGSATAQSNDVVATSPTTRHA